MFSENWEGAEYVCICSSPENKVLFETKEESIKHLDLNPTHEICVVIKKSPGKYISWSFKKDV